MDLTFWIRIWAKRMDFVRLGLQKSLSQQLRASRFLKCSLTLLLFPLVSLT
jgi:hypothetical protein